MDLNIQLIYTLSMGVAINDRRYAAKEWSQAWSALPWTDNNDKILHFVINASSAK